MGGGARELDADRRSSASDLLIGLRLNFRQLANGGSMIKLRRLQLLIHGRDIGQQACCVNLAPLLQKGCRRVAKAPLRRGQQHTLLKSRSLSFFSCSNFCYFQPRSTCCCSAGSRLLLQDRQQCVHRGDLGGHLMSCGPGRHASRLITQLWRLLAVSAGRETPGASEGARSGSAAPGAKGCKWRDLVCAPIVSAHSRDQRDAGMARDVP